MQRRAGWVVRSVAVVSLLLVGLPASPVMGAGAARGALADVVTIAPDDAWAVGRRHLLVHWDGASWTQVPWTTMLSPEYAAVDASSGSDVWAVGRVTRYDQWRPLILHWNGAAWRPSGVPQIPGEVALADVTVRSPTKAWAVGWTEVFSIEGGGRVLVRSVVLRWNGASWTRVAAPPDIRLEAVVRMGAATLWVAGTSDNGNPVILRRRDGSWRSFVVPVPAGSSCRLTDLDRHEVVGWCRDPLDRIVPYAARFGDGGLTIQDPPGRGVMLAVDVATTTFAVGSADARAALWRRNIDQETWRRAPFPAPTGGRSSLLGVSVRADREAWVVGWRTSGGQHVPFAAHWDGGAWTVTPV